MQAINSGGNLISENWGISLKAKTKTSVAPVRMSQKTAGSDNRLPTRMPEMKNSETQSKGMERLYNKTLAYEVFIRLLKICVLL